MVHVCNNADNKTLDLGCNHDVDPTSKQDVVTKLDYEV